MIQLQRFGSNIAKIIPNITYKDISRTSDQYFRIYDFPDRFNVGRTSFRIKANQQSFVYGSTIYIDIVDSSGNIIYHEIIDIDSKDKTKVIVVHVYQNTAPGEVTVYIAGRIQYDSQGNFINYDKNPDSWDYINMPNLVWIGKSIVVISQQNDSEVLFAQPPTAKCTERYEYFSTTPLNERKKTSLGTGSISIKSVTVPIQYSNTSRYQSNQIEQPNLIDLDPTGSDNFLYSRKTSLPEYFGYNTIKTDGFQFSKDMVGGNIKVNVDGTEYAANIVSILDKNTAHVDLPYTNKSSTLIGDSLIKESNFTASYISTNVNMTTFETESFVQIELENLEPIAGNVEKIRVSYLPYGSFGEFITAGEFQISEQNLLIDSQSLVPGKISIFEKPIGDLDDYTQYNDYWTISNLHESNITHSFSEPYTFDRGFGISSSCISPTTSSAENILYKISLKDQYKIKSIIGSEYKLKISSKINRHIFDTNYIDSNKYQQIDIYISGSPIISDVVHNNKLLPLLDTKLSGSYIGSITSVNGDIQLNSNFFFKTIDSGSITPIFIARNGINWEFKEINLYPRNELGYSPNQAKLMVPISNFKTDTELVLKLDYLSGTNIQSDISTTIYGLKFKGSGFPKDRLLSGSGIISSSMQFKNTLDQFTSSFNFPTGSDVGQHYDIHTQSTPSATWSFDHGLNNQRPIITVWDTYNEVVIPERIVGASNNQTLIYFPIPLTGYAAATVGSKIPEGSSSWSNITDKPLLISSSQQIASDISGSWRQVSSSLAGEKLSTTGTSVVSSSNQINEEGYSYRRFIAQNKTDDQVIGDTESYIDFDAPFSQYSTDTYHSDSGSFQISSSGTFRISGRLYFTGSALTGLSGSMININLGYKLSGGESFATQSIFLGDVLYENANLNHVNIDHFYNTATIGDHVRLTCMSLSEDSLFSLAKNQPGRNSYIKIDKL